MNYVMIKLINVGDYTLKNLSTDDKIRLLTGEGYWTSVPVPGEDIASIRFSDGPAGVRPQGDKGDNLGLNKSHPATCFPSHSALACSWNKSLIEGAGLRIGEEANAYGVNIMLAPDLNIKRNPLCGRNFEYFSEDPYLSGKAGAAYSYGLKKAGAGACLKHYAGNNREFARMVCDSVIDTKTFREIYLTGFEIAVKEGSPYAVMTAYNKLNGVYCNENAELIDILRNEWGFDGIVISDWGGTHDRPSAVKAGADLEMPPCKLSYYQVKEGIEKGEVSERDIDECVNRIKSVSNKFSPVKKVCDFKEHAEYAKNCADECCVLLKNDGVLPLNKNGKIALIGGIAQKPIIQGGGSSRVNPLDTVSLYDCVRGDISGYEQGFGKKALKLCSRADTVIVCLGLDKGEHEGADRKDLSLPEEQINFINKLDKEKKIIALLFCGSVVDLNWDDNVNALLYAGLLGQNGAKAVADILFGRVNPSGKLCETFPLNYGDIPYANEFGKNPYCEVYREKSAVGYRYFYDKKVKYSFGYGLSYTNFTYDSLTVTQEGASFYITNTGSMRGGETAQMYIRFPDGGDSPCIQLKGFKKVFLDPDERAKVFIPFDEYSFRSYDVLSGWVQVEGQYKIYIGASSQDIRLSGGIFRIGVQNISQSPVPEYGGNYKIERNKKGRVIANLQTPFCELKNCKGLAGRLLAKLALRFTRGNPTLYGTLEYLPLRMLAQYGKFGKRRTEGFLLICNGKFFKGLFRFLKKD